MTAIVDDEPACNRGRQRQRSLRIDVLLLDGTLRQVSLHYRANGQDCLDKVCHSLGVFQEVNYFGLTYYGAKREELWLNMRNRLYKQLPTVAFGGVCRLHLRVKFYVPPHMMLLEETRHQVYLDVKSRLLDRHHWLLDSDLKWSAAAATTAASVDGRDSASVSSQTSTTSESDTDSDETPLLAQLTALIVQAEFGDYSEVTSARHHRQILSRLLNKVNTDLIGNSDKDLHGESDFVELCNLAMEFHAGLSGLPSSTAEYRMMQAASIGLLMYGSHYHDAKDHQDCRLCVAVGPGAVWLCRQDCKVSIERYPYPRVQQVTISDRFLYLSLSQENGNIREVGFRLATPKAANCLYRCVTETHSFFRCDTVRNNVATKTCRDVKGAFVSLFVEGDLWSARNFVFDVQRTAKEVHDNARRQMHKCLTAGSASGACNDDVSKRQSGIQRRRNVQSSDEDKDGETRASLLDRILRLEQSRQCQICMDACLSVVFQPCSHMLACQDCASRLDTCPVCRAVISDRLVCFTPWQ